VSVRDAGRVRFDRERAGPFFERSRCREHYLWGLSHLLPFFTRKPVVKISKRDCERIRGKLFADSEALRVLIDVGGKPTYENGHPRKPLALRSIGSVMALLAQILGDTVDARAGQDLQRSQRPHRMARSARY
jgi:hypothetical protein